MTAPPVNIRTIESAKGCRMKKLLLLSLGLILAFGSSATAADLKADLQKGLFEEEGNRDFKAAIERYQAVLTEHEKDRALAATAAFRLAECYKKLKRTNEAVQAYQRVVTDYPGEASLVSLSREALTALGTSPIGRIDSNVEAVDDEAREIRRIETLIKNSPDLINAATEDGKTLLAAAAAKGQMAVVNFLIEKGAEINAQTGPLGLTPLHWAASTGNKAIAELLPKKGAKVDIRSKEGETPLHLAAQKGYKQVAESLINAGAEINAQSPRRGTPLNVAAQNGNSEMIRFLVAKGADLEALAPGNWSALISAVRINDPTTTSTLLDLGIKTDRPEPLLLAISNHNRDIVEILLKHGVSPNQPNRPTSPTAIALAQKDFAIAELLLRNGADPNQGEPPLLSIAIDSNASSELVRLILEKGANVNARERNGDTALSKAVGSSNPELVDILLKAKADPNSEIRGSSAFTLAESMQTDPQESRRAPNRQIIELLKKAGADENALRRRVISVTSAADHLGIPIFSQGTNTNSRYFLTDLLGKLYGRQRQISSYRNQGLFPDLKKSKSAGLMDPPRSKFQ
jgi:ankyrin repeat protein